MNTRALERLYVYWMVSTLLLLTVGVVVALLFWGEIQSQNRRLNDLEARAIAPMTDAPLDSAGAAARE